MTIIMREVGDIATAATTPAVQSGPACRQRAGLEIDLVSAEFAAPPERLGAEDAGDSAAKKVRRAEPGFGSASNPKLAN